MEDNKTGYWYIGPRSAWDDMPIGLFPSREEAERHNYYPYGEIKEATPEMVERLIRKANQNRQVRQ